MIIASWILLIVSIVLCLYSLFTFASVVTALAMGKGKKAKKTNAEAYDIACIITAYGDAAIAVNQVKSILFQKYPAQKYHVYMVGDNCAPNTDFPEHNSVSLIYPTTALHSKIKSIALAIERFVRPHTHILILDADNLLHNEVLARLNATLQMGYKVVQGQRTAKNLDTTIAALDSLSEYYYNVSQRWAPWLLGSSATIAGSGMVVEANFFNNYVRTLLHNNENKIILAEDKLLQMMLVQADLKIAYCREALIFDEKVREGAQVQRQRTRWLRSWFDHWGQSMSLGLSGLFKGSWNQFYFGIMLSVPPMVMLVGGLLLTAAAGIIFSWGAFLLSIAGIGMFFTGFLLSLLMAPAPARVWQAIPFIPVFVMRQVMAILKIKASNKDFMATSHTQFTDIEQVWQMRKNDFPYIKNEA